jgi:auxin response factor
MIYESALVLYILGPWKSPSESTRTLSFTNPQRARELFPSVPTSTFPSSSNIGFNSMNEPSMLNNQFYWSMRDPRADSCAASTNNVTVEKKRETGSAGCRLFGIEICSAEEEALPVVTAARPCYDQTAASVNFASDKLSQPSDVNNSDTPAASRECSPLESQSRQVRSCTKVIIYNIIFIFKIFFSCFWFTDSLINVPPVGNYARNSGWKGC